jgi:nucleotide-binding universal stress UspA family protein
MARLESGGRASAVLQLIAAHTSPALSASCGELQSCGSIQTPDITTSSSRRSTLRAAMFLNILVAIDGSVSSLRALERAIDIARAMNSRLTLITVAPPLSHYVTLAGVSAETMLTELDKWAADVLTEAASLVPDDVIAHRIQRSGHAGPEILKELERGRYDLVVVGSRGRGRTQEGLLGSVNGYLHFHSRVPLLSVRDGAE